MLHRCAHVRGSLQAQSSPRPRNHWRFASIWLIFSLWTGQRWKLVKSRLQIIMLQMSLYHISIRKPLWDLADVSIETGVFKYARREQDRLHWKHTLVDMYRLTVSWSIPPSFTYLFHPCSSYFQETPARQQFFVLVRIQFSKQASGVVLCCEDKLS